MQGRYRAPKMRARLRVGFAVADPARVQSDPNAGGIIHDNRFPLGPHSIA